MTTPTDIQPLTETQTLQNTSISHGTIASEPSQPPQPKRHRRWGRIACLPTKVRLHINQSLRDGAIYKQILQDLAAAGYDAITYDMLLKWNHTGFQDWLRDQEHFEKLVLTTDAARINQPSRKSRKNFRTLSQLDIAVQLHTAARQFNLDKFCEHLNTKPETYLRLVHANALHERNAILHDRNKIELKKVAVKNKTKKPTVTPKAIPTRMDIERYKRELKIVAPEHQPIEYREPITSLPSA